LPGEFPGHLAAATFNIIYGNIFRIGLVFIIDDNFFSPFRGMVVIICSKCFSVRLEFRLFDIPVEPEDLRLISVNQLSAS
jgi:hypothetical protein